MNGKTGEHFNKSRYGRVSTKRKFNEDDQGTYGALSLSATTIGKNKSKLSLPVSNHININMQNGKINGYEIGDILWAKTGKYPVWPGIVINDPETNNYYKSKLRCSSVLFC